MIRLHSFTPAMLTALLLLGCQTQEKERLEGKLDSVNQELEITKQALLDAHQVEIILDSIDASRKVMGNLVMKDTDARHNLTRLNDINSYIKDINLKMDQMEKSIRYVNTMAASILKLQADIEARTQKISKLEADAYKINNNNRAINLTLQQKDSTLAAFIATCHQDVATLQKVMEDIHAKNNIATANLYFKQAESLTAMASDLKPASKKKFVQREALEMYKISFSLGKKEAKQKITNLETQLL